ncbi:hypothetical protein HRbin34_00233 [bacterium HR34]|nr:hypothetical protein HRbin34_00233 [bacterium HR34]
MEITIIKKKNIIVSFLISAFLLSFAFVFAQGNQLNNFSNGSFKNGTNQIEIPRDLKDIENMGDKVIETTKILVPKIIKQIWEEKILPIWQKMWDYARNLWEKHFADSFNNFLKQLEEWLGVTFKERKELTKEKFEKEKEEFTKEAPELGKSLWEKLWELIK